MSVIPVLPGSGQKAHPSPRTKVAIVGGGPGGLFTAWNLKNKIGDACEITIFEASERPGGKVVTGEFVGVGPYEAGVAEIYDYSRIGPDPLHDLIVEDLGLEIKYISGGPCVLDGKIVLTVDDLAQHFGERVSDEVAAFHARCAELLSPEDYYLSVQEADNGHAWAKISGQELLTQELKCDAARRYVRTMAHSDVAADPHQTNGLNFLKNVLMDIDGYIDIFSVVGGNEQIIRRLVNKLDAEIRLNSNVRAVQPLPDGTYRLEIDTNGVCETTVADFVVIAVQLSSLSRIHWRSEKLQEVVDRHVRYFDRPGHYLRATLLFERPFWRDHLNTQWWMLDAFEGCCVYDEGARHDLGNWGALSFLIAGNAALDLTNVPDERIERMCLDALPPALSQGRKLIVDRRINRWVATVNAIPGGMPVRRRADNHHPDPLNLPGIILVGDYLFDATLNGVMESADVGTDIILAEILKSGRVRRMAAEIAETECRSERASTADPLEHFFPANALADLLSIAWDLKKGARILHFGSMSGRTVAALRALGYDAFGVEFDQLAHATTPRDMEQCNLLGTPARLPFDDHAFEVVFETGLCRLASEETAKAIEEIRRVTKQGLVLGSVTIDLPIDLFERHDLLAGVKTLESSWDWSGRLHAGGFIHTLWEQQRLDKIWKRAEASGAGPGHWYQDAEAVFYCFYRPLMHLAPTPVVPSSGQPGSA
jgi:monoamine oxidase/SAM-dependent methyltransferase